MNKQHEQSVADAFCASFKQIASGKGKTLTRASLDGQDAIYGGDYIFTDSTKFLLVEFKYEERNLRSEYNKPKRLVLCQELDRSAFNRRLSLACHYIAWSKKRHERRNIDFNQYYYEICNQEIFKQDKYLTQKASDKTLRIPAEGLADDFLAGSLGATYYEFKQYTDFLKSLSKTGGGEMELIVGDPNSNQIDLIDIKSIQSLKLWLERNDPHARKSSGPHVGRTPRP